MRPELSMDPYVGDPVPNLCHPYDHNECNRRLSLTAFSMLARTNSVLVLQMVFATRLLLVHGFVPCLQRRILLAPSAFGVRRSMASSSATRLVRTCPCSTRRVLHNSGKEGDCLQHLRRFISLMLASFVHCVPMIHCNS